MVLNETSRQKRTFERDLEFRLNAYEFVCSFIRDWNKAHSKNFRYAIDVITISVELLSLIHETKESRINQLSKYMTTNNHRPKYYAYCIATLYECYMQAIKRRPFDYSKPDFDWEECTWTVEKSHAIEMTKAIEEGSWKQVEP